MFLVSVPFGLAGTLWAYFKLRETSRRRAATIDWPGNITFALGLIAIMVGITYGIQPYGGHTMGWTSPVVLSELAIGAAFLGAFGVIERKRAEPMFRLSLFRIRAFTAGVMSSFLAAVARGGLMFMMIIWLQGIWLPEHGFSFEQTPLWAGIYMLPLTAGFLIAGPVSGALSDRFGSRPFATGGMLLAAASFILLEILPINFSYWTFALLLLMNGLAMGAFASSQPGGRDEQPAPPGPGGRLRHERHLPELRPGALDRDLLHSGHRGPVGHAPDEPQPRPYRPRHLTASSRTSRQPASGVDPVRRLSWVQPSGPLLPAQRPVQPAARPSGP